MRRIEFAGLPGSGKTTIAGGACSVLCARGSVFYDRTRLAGIPGRLPSRGLAMLQALAPPPWRDRIVRHLFSTAIVPEAKGRVALEFPELLSAICGAVVNGGETPALARHFIGLAVDVMAWDLIASERLREDEVFFCDEGFAQRAISLHTPGQPNDWVALLPGIDLLFVVRARPDTCIERMRSRSRGPTRRLLGRSDSEVEAILGRMEQALSAVEHELARSGSEIVVVDTDELDRATATRMVVDRSSVWCGDHR